MHAFCSTKLIAALLREFSLFTVFTLFSFQKKPYNISPAKKSFKQADYILFVDAHDVIFVGGLEEIERKIKLFPEHDCIFSAEKACWPDGSP